MWNKRGEIMNGITHGIVDGILYMFNRSKNVEFRLKDIWNVE